MDFRSGKELLELCREEGLPISEIMKRRETDSGLRTEEEMLREMEQVAEIMQAAVKKQLEKPERSLSGLIGGEGRKVLEFGSGKRSVCDSLMTRVIAYSMAVLEVNASMGLIVAAPTAGSSGVIPGALLAVKEERGLTEEEVRQGLFCAGAVGYLLMRNASVSGAEAGCQAEVGSASAMAAAAVTEMMGGTPRNVPERSRHGAFQSSGTGLRSCGGAGGGALPEPEFYRGAKCSGLRTGKSERCGFSHSF